MSIPITYFAPSHVTPPRLFNGLDVGRGGGWATKKEAMRETMSVQSDANRTKP